MSPLYAALVDLAAARKERNEAMDESEFPTFVGWMLWNMVSTQAAESGADWPGGIFEDQPKRVQEAWNNAAAELQSRAQVFGRLM